MTEAEKRMAEWEARHDVAARGHRAGPDVLQHYFAHEQLTHAERVPAEAHPASPEQPAGRSGETEPADRPHGWLRRVFRR
jgi:hypothetical protein